MSRLFVIIAALLTASTAAQAHVAIGDTAGFMRGIEHPMSGIDHILAMVAVGLFAAHLGGRALWLVPLSFVSMMVGGGALGMAGDPLPFGEVGVGLSVVVFGITVALSFDIPTAAAMVLVGFFAIFHGHAHGAEMPVSASGLKYGVGFVVASATLHAVGICLGLVIGKTSQPYGRRILQTAGGAMALTGVAILAGYI
jgi:urease accessory protein